MAIKKKKVLLIEDNARLSKVIVFKLEHIGLKVKSVFTAKEGLSYLVGNIKPDLIWLDLYLPGMNGFEFLQELKTIPKCKDIPVVVVTCSYGASCDMKQAFPYDIAGYFIKSDFDLNQIVCEVNKIVSEK